MQQRAFTPIPRAERHVPGRVRSAFCRFYTERFVEHAEAARFLKDHAEDGNAGALVVRALLAYSDYQSSDAFEPPYEFARMQPTPGGDSGRFESLSIRLYIDKYREHRLAAEMIAEAAELHGEAMKLIIRSLLYYRDTLAAAQNPRRAQLAVAVG